MIINICHLNFKAYIVYLFEKYKKLLLFALFTNNDNVLFCLDMNTDKAKDKCG